MKTNWLGFLLFVLLVSDVQVPAQSTKTNHSNGWHPPASDQIIQPSPPGDATNASAIIVSAKLDAVTALAASGALPENVNYAVKNPDESGLSFLESVPAVSVKLKTPNTADEKFEDVVKSAQDAAVLVLVY